MPSAQVKVGHLLAAAPAVLLFCGAHAQPEAVDAGIEACKLQGAQLPHAADLHAQLIAEGYRVPVFHRLRRRDTERTAFGDVILDFIVSAVHVHGLFAAADKDQRHAVVTVKDRAEAAAQSQAAAIYCQLHTLSPVRISNGRLQNRTSRPGPSASRHGGP